MVLKLVSLKAENVATFKRDMQEAFQYGYEKVYRTSDELILPEKDIDDSLNTNGAKAYQAIVDNEVFGGTVITVNNETHHNHLDFLFVKVGCQGTGVGQALWMAIENLHPEAKVWETCTTYFEKRNIHFNVNKCGFHIVEFYNDHHPDPHAGDDQDREQMFLFEKTVSFT